VRIRLDESGGFAYIPALQKSIEIDTETLPADEAEALKGLIGEVESAQAASTTRKAPPGGDRKEYVLSIDDGTSRSVTLQDPLTHSPSADLVHKLKSYRPSAKS
jgi:hypothetical protein